MFPAAAAIALVLPPHSLPVVLPAAALLGGVMSTLYPVCVAHAHNRMPTDRVVAVSGQLILVSGLEPSVPFGLHRACVAAGVRQQMRPNLKWHACELAHT